MWILVTEMRATVHRDRLRVGVRGHFMEGARRIGDVVTRVIISADQFARTALQTETVCSAIVFGMDLAAVRQQAWHRLANSTTVPLQPEWRDWLWDEVLQPERLYSFGNPQRRQAWRISWQEEELAERVRAGVREQALG